MDRVSARAGLPDQASGPSDRLESALAALSLRGVKAALAAGADPNADCGGGRRSLHLCALAGAAAGSGGEEKALEIQTELLAAGADPRLRDGSWAAASKLWACERFRLANLAKACELSGDLELMKIVAVGDGNLADAAARSFARLADPSAVHEGVVVARRGGYVIQRGDGGAAVAHPEAAFARKPRVGARALVSYENGKARALSAELGRSL